ncbi:MAG: hypothetical protein IJ574_01415 [Bacilli bacterium]|nr:hypothetical protein [Bacilli bacterium]
MKKNRNAFFSEAQMSTQSYYPQQPIMMNQAAPYQAAQSSQSFYAGPSIPANYNNQPNNTNYGYDYSTTNDIETRLSKIERQLNRIDARLNKLESNTYYTTDITENSNTSLYMV